MAKKRQKKLQKGDKLSLFKNPSVAFCRPPKKATKRRQKATICRFLLCSCPPQLLLVNGLEKTLVSAVKTRVSNLSRSSALLQFSAS